MQVRPSVCYRSATRSKWKFQLMCEMSDWYDAPKMSSRRTQSKRREGGGARLWVLVPLLILVNVLVLYAQKWELHPLSTQIAGALNKAKKKSVVVFDFVGPDEKQRSPGRRVADEISDALQTSGNSFRVIDRSTVEALFEKNRLAPQVTLNGEVASWLALQLGAEAFVVGKLSNEAGQLRITSDSYQVKNGKRIGGFGVLIPLDEAWKQWATAAQSEGIVAEMSSLNKTAYPRCMYCPNPPFPENAIRRHAQGSVILGVVVGVDGRARDISIAKGADGFTLKAIQAVQSWKFQPATGPDGKAVAVRTPIEVTWRLY